MRRVAEFAQSALQIGAAGIERDMLPDDDRVASESLGFFRSNFSFDIVLSWLLSCGATACVLDGKPGCPWGGDSAMEPTTGIEPVTSSLPRTCSAN